MESYELKSRLSAFGYWLSANSYRLLAFASRLQILVLEFACFAKQEKLRQPRSGERMQPTAQAVGDTQKSRGSPEGAEEDSPPILGQCLIAWRKAGG
jgi:hypothetical protein